MPVGSRWRMRAAAPLALLLLSACSLEVEHYSADDTPSSCPTPDRIESYESFSERGDCFASHHVGIPQPGDLNAVNELLGVNGFGSSGGTISRFNSGVISICISLVGGGEPPRVAARAQTWMAKDVKSPISADLAQSVVELVDSQAWCRLVANES